jgi:hypothetical protein
VIGYCLGECTAAVEIQATGEAVDLEVSDNTIELPPFEFRAEGISQNYGLNVFAALDPGEITGLDLRVLNNTISGYAGDDFSERAAATVAASIGFESASVAVTGNSITAPELPVGEGELSPFGITGLNVAVGGAGAADVDVSDNDVTGFAGQAELIGGHAATQVQVLVDRAHVTVTNNEITAPVASSFGKQDRPGLNVLVAATSGLEEESNGNPEGDDGEGEERDPDVLVSDNRVIDYTGSSFLDLGEGVEFDGAAVNVFSTGDLLTEVSSNQISAPEFTPGSGTGVGLLVLGIGSNTGGEGVALDVLDNVVDGYGQIGFDVFGNEGGFEDINAPAVAVVALGQDEGISDDVSVAVSGNQISAETGDDTESPVGLLVQAAGSQQIAVNVDVDVNDNTVTGYTGRNFFDDLSAENSPEGIGELDRNAAVIVEAFGAPDEIVIPGPEGGPSFIGDLDITVTDNTITAPDDELTGIGLDVSLASFGTSTATVSGNTVDGYAGAFFDGALAVDVDSENPATTTVENNTVTAPSFEQSGTEGFQELPVRGISVSSLAGFLAGEGTNSVSVLGNTVDGYFGAGSGVNGLFGAAAAGISVDARNLDGGGQIAVTVDDNDVTAPESPLETGPGVSIFADAIGDLASGNEGFAPGDVTVIVTDNDVRDYSGSLSHAAVEVEAGGEEVMVLVGTDEEGNERGNTVTAPSQGGTTGIDVDTFGENVTVAVENNDVRDYGFPLLQQRLGEGEFFPEIFTSVVVTTFAEDSEVSVSSNTVTLSEGAGQGGIFVGGRTDDTFDVTVSDNTVDGYLGGLGGSGIPNPEGGGVFPGAITVDVEADDDDLTVAVNGNDVTAPDEPSIGPSGPGILIDARTDNEGVVTVSVNENDVDGYTGSPEFGAVDITVEADVDVGRVFVGTNEEGDDLGNTVTAPSDGGFVGINVSNFSFAMDTVVHDNTVVGYGRDIVPVSESERGPEVSSGSAIRVRVENFGLSDVTVSDNTVRAPSQGGLTGIFVGGDTDSGSTTLSDNQVTDYSNGLNVNLSTEQVTTVSVTGNEVQTDSSTADGLFMRVSTGGLSTVDVNVEDNTVDGSGDDGLDIRIASSGVLTGADVSVVNNDVDDSGDDGIAVVNEDTDSTIDTTIGGNNVDDYGDDGIELSVALDGELAVTSDVDGTIENNEVDPDDGDELETNGNVTGTIRINDEDVDLN